MRGIVAVACAPDAIGAALVGATVVEGIDEAGPAPKFGVGAGRDAGPPVGPSRPWCR